MDKKTLGVIVGLTFATLGLSYSQSDSREVYRARPGDTFNEIYEDYGGNLSLEEFKKLNNKLLMDNGSFDKLDVGVEIYIRKNSEKVLEDMNGEISRNNSVIGEKRSTDSEYLSELLGEDILDFLESGKGDIVNGGFKKYVYGNIVEGLSNHVKDNSNIKEESLVVIDNIIQDYIGMAPQSINNSRPLGDFGNYYSNLNLMLGVYKEISGSDKYKDLNTRITKHLVQNSGEENNFHFPSYPNEERAWPSDQAFVLHTINLYNKNYNTDFGEGLIKEWEEFILENNIDKETGLPITDVNRVSSVSLNPRGSATSYLIMYTSKFDKELAKKWWSNFENSDFLADFGFISGFKEYLSSDRNPDVDSGPIIFGIGSSATALGIGAAYSVGDDYTGDKLSLLVDAGKLYSKIVGGEIENLSSDIVAKAIEFNMESMKYSLE